jgi:hypothetical protein
MLSGIVTHGLLLSPVSGGWGLIVLFIIPIGVIKEEALNSIHPLQPTPYRLAAAPACRQTIYVKLFVRKI